MCNYDEMDMIFFTDEQSIYIEQVKKEALKKFAKKLKDAYPEGNRDTHMPMIGWDDFCYIVDETLEEYLDE